MARTARLDAFRLGAEGLQGGEHALAGPPTRRPYLHAKRHANPAPGRQRGERGSRSPMRGAIPIQVDRQPPPTYPSPTPRTTSVPSPRLASASSCLPRGSREAWARAPAPAGSARGRRGLDREPGWPVTRSGEPIGEGWKVGSEQGGVGAGHFNSKCTTVPRSRGVPGGGL
jgi:hypothetical protein